MSQTGLDFDYETLLEECTAQSKLLTKFEKQKAQLGENYKESKRQLKVVLNDLAAKKDLNDNLKFLMAEKLNIQARLNEKLTFLGDKTNKIHEQISRMSNDGYQFGFLENMDQLCKNYENLDSEFDDESLFEKIAEYENKIENLSRNLKQHENILGDAKKSWNEREDFSYLKSLNTLTESISIEADESFGSYEYSKQKIATILKNIETLEKNTAEILSKLH